MSKKMNEEDYSEWH